MIIKCQTCNKEFNKRPSQIGKRNFCSNKCAGKAYAKELTGKKLSKWIVYKCKNCKSEFEIPKWRVKHRPNCTYCSNKCRDEYRHKFETGPNNKGWLGGSSTRRQSRHWLIARMSVVKEQKGLCAICGKYCGNSLPVHHRVPYREFKSPSLANARSNLIGLCQSCHMRLEPRKRNGQIFYPSLSDLLGHIL